MPKIKANPEYEEYLQPLMIKYKSRLKSFEEILDKEDLTVKELLNFLDGEQLIIVLGENCSGINVINLEPMELDEWTW